MKNKKLIAIIVVICLSIFILITIKFSCFSYLASVKGSVTSKASSNSNASFKVKKGDKMSITFDSAVKQGNLKLQLTDSNGKEIEKFDTNKENSKQMYFDKVGEYTISANYNNFIGDYDIKCR